MAMIKPFKGIRPIAKKAQKVAALPYDVMNSQEARKAAEGNADSFLHVDKAEIDLEPSVGLYEDCVYEKAAENLKSMIERGVLKKESKEVFYIYQLKMGQNIQTGIVVCTSIDEYIDGTIKKHELTRQDKEIDRIKHVDRCNANTGPIFLAYESNAEISAVLKEYMKKNNAVYDFVSEDNVKQKVWVIDNDTIIKKLILLFEKVPHLYIADGHHRNASAVKVGLERRKQNINYTGKEEFNYYLSVLFASDELHIMDYNRLVKDLNGNTKESFLNQVSEKFDIAAYEGKDCCRPQKIHEFGMYLEGQWYIIRIKPEYIKNDIVEDLDVSILQNEILCPILGIGDPRTDKRIDFLGGIRGLSALQKRVDSGEMKLAFSMFPTSMEELMKVANENKIMPPKSTWFEPKLRSGLFIHSLED